MQRVLDTEGSHLEDGSCVTDCSIGNYKNDGICSSCDSSCADCEESASRCIACADNLFLDSANKRCVSECPTSYFGDEATSNCDDCDVCDEDQVRYQIGGDLFLPGCPISSLECCSSSHHRAGMKVSESVLN